MKIWEMENTDIVRFVITRKEWELLLGAVATAAARSTTENHETMWGALDVLKKAEEDSDASEMVKCLTEIARLTKRKTDNDSTIINNWATRGLKWME
jgi:hypothetical protein